MNTERLIEGAIRFNRDLAAEIKPVFLDRTQAGQRLAALLLEQDFSNPVLFAIPKGGIPIALPVRQTLNSTLHYSLAAKIPAGADTRFGFGALSHRTTLINPDLAEMFMLEPDGPIIRRGIAHASAALAENQQLTNHDNFPLSLEGQTAIIIDDGVSTGYTAIAAAALIETLKPDRIVIAAPVASKMGCDHLRSQGFETIVLHEVSTPGFLVDNFYESFPDLSVDDVRALIQSEDR